MKRTDESTNPSADRVLDALEWRSCRTVLAALEPTPQTVNELSEDCSLPVSSIYRSLHELVDAGLVAESTRFCDGRRPSNAYALRTGEVVIGLVDGPSVELRAVDDRAATDGGDGGE